jgi:cephalosporin hydroxylase
MNKLKEAISTAFHIMYYDSQVWNAGRTKWMGVTTVQTPFDLWVMQEIIFETKANLFIETGSGFGGSALFIATCFPEIKVISIDIQREGARPSFTHPRISFLKGGSLDVAILEEVRKQVDGKKVMVLLDSDHSAKNVLEELEGYSKFVSLGCYLVIHDTNIGDNPVRTVGLDPGPKVAVEDFLKYHQEFQVDKSREKFYLTFSPNGWLRREGG